MPPAQSSKQAAADLQPIQRGYRDRRIIKVKDRMYMYIYILSFTLMSDVICQQAV